MTKIIKRILKWALTILRKIKNRANGIEAEYTLFKIEYNITFTKNCIQNSFFYVGKKTAPHCILMARWLVFNNS